ncbi:MAG: tocopherol O-methyltransferase [Glaciecola sp.]|jgi:tocopherol O-methyltransferase
MGYRSDFNSSKTKDKDSQDYKVNRYYESSAADYMAIWTNKKDLSMHFGFFDEKAKSHRESLFRMNEKLAEFAGVKNDWRVVDSGCGYGNGACWLAENFNSSVIGLNIVPYQIKMAKAKAMKLDHLVQFDLQNMEKTDLPAESFDLFWAQESTVRAKSKENVIKEAHRLLDKQGKIMICEYFLRSAPDLNEDEEKMMKPWYDGWAMPKFWTEEQYRIAMEDAGFTNVVFHDITKNVIPSFKRLYRLCSIFLLVGRMNVKLGIISKDR